MDCVRRQISGLRPRLVVALAALATTLSARRWICCPHDVEQTGMHPGSCPLIAYIWVLGNWEDSLGYSSPFRKAVDLYANGLVPLRLR